MSSSDSMYRVSNKKQVTPKVPSLTIEVQYPQTWFTANPGKKPPLSIVLSAESLDRARAAIKKNIVDNTINLELAKTFLYYFALTIRDELEEEWISYGVKIGDAKQNIGPLDLLDCKTTVRTMEVAIIADVKKTDDAWLAGYLLAIYRMIRASTAKYKSTISQKITVQMRSLCATAHKMTDIVDLYAGWANDRGYNTLVAAYDMFFHKFPLHDLARLRIGTTGSRFRDCSALISYGYFTELVGMTRLTELMDWVFIEQIGTDIDRMMLTDDELNVTHSYFPYHVDLGIVSKSAFSASSNPHFFEWVHIAGALLRSQRSMNARHISDARSLEILANAACLAYAFSNSFGFVTKGVLKSRDATLWCTMIRNANGSLPGPVRRYVSKIVKQIDEPREGTIANHLKIIATDFDKQVS